MMNKTTFFPLLLAGVAAGCGTTRITDTQRTATEQLLVSNAIDQAVSHIDLQCLAGKPVYFDAQYLEGVVDRGYLVSSLRQHLLANGCVLQEDRAKAVYVVEVRSGGVGTNRHGLLVGIPQMSVPTLVPGQPAQIPEIPLAKKTDQEGVAKIAVFAYNRLTGQPVWQSGVVQAASTSKDTWLFGAGPFEHGTIRQSTTFAGEPIVPLLALGGKKEADAEAAAVPVTQAASWTESARTDLNPVRPAGGPPPKPAAEAPAIGSTNQMVLELMGGTSVDKDATAAPPEPDDRPTPAGSATPPKPFPTPPIARNKGGDEENEPSKVFSSGLTVPKPAKGTEADTGKPADSGGGAKQTAAKKKSGT